ncbi:hypothetical protein SteCoe_13744 [Stentor coeruleus]|uniref:Uncharacterized protein n=1 Tax=Stentor coeruleus TaxID=5963 RepID=A0A1R2C7M3_9CILI|nr:hypothetical protein SteCoe_13744 [Stentor coeruleus]
MYSANDIAEQEALLSNQKIYHNEFFSKVNHKTDSPINPLPAFSAQDSNPKNTQTKPSNYNWLSDSQYTYQSYLLLSPNFPLPTSAYHPKPIPENDPKQSDQIPTINPKKISTSPKPRQNTPICLSHATKQPSPKIKHKNTLKQKASIDKYKLATRSMPDSSFKKYFGKPVFANYGHANKSPIFGGFLYGNYMKSYNSAPHDGNKDLSKLKVLENVQDRAMKKQDKIQILNRICKDEIKVSCFEEESKLKKKQQILPSDKNVNIKDIAKIDLLEKKPLKSERKLETEDNTAGKAEEIIVKKHENTKKICGQSKFLLQKSISAREVLEPQMPLKKLANANNLKEQPIIKNQNLNKNKSIQAHNESIQNHPEISIACNEEKIIKSLSENNNQVVEPKKYCPCCNKLYKKRLTQSQFCSGKVFNLPIQHPEEIPAAGKLTYRSPSAYTIIYDSNQL